MFASVSTSSLVVRLASVLLFTVGVGFVVHAVRRIIPAHEQLGRYGTETSTETSTGTRPGPLAIGTTLLLGGIVLLVLARDLSS